jgi:hypothetical protein
MYHRLNNTHDDKGLGHENRMELESCNAASRPPGVKIFDDRLKDSTYWLLTCWKILVFRSFQILQCTRINKVSKSQQSSFRALYLATSYQF